VSATSTSFGLFCGAIKMARFLPPQTAMANDTRRLLGGSTLLCVAVTVFAFGPLPIANALYACGLWPRLTPDEVLVKLQRDYKVNVSECVTGSNGWQYICQLPGRPGIRQFYDKLGVEGSPFGIGLTVELRPGPIPSRESYLNRK
jgi:hypothetical protein